MDFDLTETQKLFKRSAREFFAQECPPEAVRQMIETGEPYSAELWKKLVEQGWTGLIFPEQVGGMGLGMIELAIAFEEMGRALVPGPLLSSVPLAGSLLLSCANNHVQGAISAICDGSAKATIALLEASASWDLDRVRLSATNSANGIVLSGKKVFVPDAAEADLILVAARMEGELILSLVRRGHPGLSMRLLPSLDATRNLYELEFDQVTVESGSILARGKSARFALEHALDVATLALAAEMVGGMEWLLDASVEYAKTRKQFGKAIGQFQAVQHHCADMLLMMESARSAVYFAAWTLESEPAEAPAAVSIAKAYASDAYREVGNLAIQVHGGVGFTWDENIHFYYKRAKASELMFGDATYHRERLARLIIDQEAQGIG